MYSGLSVRGRGQGLSPAAMNVSPGYFHSKIEEKFPSCFIPCLLVVFTQQLEILVTAL